MGHNENIKLYLITALHGFGQDKSILGRVYDAEMQGKNDAR